MRLSTAQFVCFAPRNVGIQYMTFKYALWVKNVVSYVYVCVCMVAGHTETENALGAIVPFKSPKREIPVGVYLNYLPK